MSKYGWIPEGVEELINRAVQLRVKRWTTIGIFFHPGGRMMTKEEQDKYQEGERRRYKYMASAAVRAALWNAEHCRPLNSGPVDWPKLRKRLMKEISRRYDVVDRAYGAKVLRQNGTLTKVSR